MQFYSSTWVCIRGMGETWGINSRLALWMYKAILLPKLLYVSEVWWPMVSRVEARNLLQSRQGSYLGAAVESIKTTSIEVLDVTLCQTPLDLTAFEAAGLTAYRLKCQEEWMDTELHHAKLDFLWKHPFTLNQDRILKKYQLVKPFKIWIPTQQYWQKPDKIIDPNVGLWFTDGSGIHHCFGAGFYRPLYNYRESIPMGSLSTVFSAEMMDILRCRELLLTKNLIRRRIHICSDSRAALAALAKTTTESSLV
jgi:hypothetical protein